MKKKNKIKTIFLLSILIANESVDEIAAEIVVDVQLNHVMNYRHHHWYRLHPYLLALLNYPIAGNFLLMNDASG